MPAPQGRPDQSLLVRVDSLCDSFERDWRAGNRTTIESVLAENPQLPKSTLLRYLIPLEVSLQRENGGLPNLADYQSRFPDQSNLLRAALLPDGKPTTQCAGRTEPVLAFPELEDQNVWQHFAADGRFDILNRIGEGSFSVVYRAWDNRLDRFVAIKVPRPDGDEHRFRTEARSLARVDHPGVVQIYDVIVDGPLHYIVLEYVGGGDLRQCLLDGGLSESDSVQFLRNAAAAVAAAHDQQVLHRDLKPSNILLDATQQPRVTDFGLARLLEDKERRSGPGDLLGTVEYMAPDQALGNASPRSDVYSLGVILFEMLTGRLPASGSRAEVLAQLLSGRAAEFVWPPHGNSVLESVCRKCLAPEPNDRYQDAGELVADLDRYLNGQPTQGTAQSDGRARRVVPKLAGVGLLLVIFVAGTAMNSDRRNTPDISTGKPDASANKPDSPNEPDAPTNTSGSAKKDSPVVKVARNPIRFAHNERWVRDIAISPAEDLVVTSCADGSIWLRPGPSPDSSTEDEPPIRIPAHRGGVLEIAFRPDGSEIATVSVDSTAQVWSLPECQRLRTLDGHSGAVMAVCYSPNGDVMATVDSLGFIRIWDADSGAMIGEPEGDLTGICKTLEFSPDGATLIYVGDYWRAPEKDGLDLPPGAPRRQPQIVLLDVATRDRQVFKPSTRRIWDMTYSPQGDIVLAVTTSDGTEGVLFCDSETMNELATVPLPLTPTEVEFVDTAKLAVSDFDGGIHVLDLRTSTLITASSGHTDYVTELVWSAEMDRLFSASFDGFSLALPPFWTAGSTAVRVGLPQKITGVRLD